MHAPPPDVHVRFRRRANLPIIIASGILNAPVKVQEASSENAMNIRQRLIAPVRLDRHGHFSRVTTAMSRRFNRITLSERLFLLAIFSTPFLALSPLRPLWGIPTGVLFGVLVLLCLVALIGEIGVKRSLSGQWQPPPLLKLLCLFLLVNLISLANAGIERGLGKENYIQCAYLAFSILVFCVVAAFAGKIETLTRIMKVYLLAATISVIWSLGVTIGFMAGLDTGQRLT